MQTAERESAETLLRSKGLRVTAKRVAVLRAIADAGKPISHSQLVVAMRDRNLDPATVYRNLVKLKDAGLVRVVSRADGIDRYVFSEQSDDEHTHPHFVCNDCGEVTCLPFEVVPQKADTGAWSASVMSAQVQLRGECPDCFTTG